MFDEEFISLLNKKINYEIVAQLQFLKDEIEKIHNETITKRTSQPGMTLSKIAKICKKSIPQRAEVISQTITNAVQDIGIKDTNGLGEQLKKIASKHLYKNRGDLSVYLKQPRLVGRSTTERSIKKFENDFRLTRKFQLRRIHNEIESLINKIKNKTPE
jgi:hypothetical protein